MYVIIRGNRRLLNWWKNDNFSKIFRRLGGIAKEEEELQNMIDRLVETGPWYGMEISIEKSKVLRIESMTEQLSLVVGNQHPANVNVIFEVTGKYHHKKCFMNQGDKIKNSFS